MLVPACISQDITQIVTLSTQSVGPIHAQIRVRKSIRYQTTGCSSLAELVVPFEDVRITRSMRPVRTVTTKFTIVVAVMAIATEDAWTGGPSGGLPADREHIVQQARLRKRTAAIVEYRMAGGCRRAELGNHIQKVRVRDLPHRSIAINNEPLLTGASAVASQTTFILINCGHDRRNSIECADTFYPRL